MDPRTFTTNILEPGLAFLHRLGGPAPSAAARQKLLTIGLQESALVARYQASPSASPGAAKGFFQFESGGGVRGVMTHQASAQLARRLCDACWVAWNEQAVYRALEG